MTIKKIIFIFAIKLSLSNTICPLNSEEAQKIGMLIWQNEASGRTDLLVFWNQHESFPSLGIGNCIWYPEGQEASYTQQFPALCDYLQKHDIQLPKWLEKAKLTGAPWKSRDEFLQDQRRTEELRLLLSSTIDLQTNFMIKRLDEQWPLILQVIPNEKKEQIEYFFQLMKTSPLGSYALIDYLNFKGSGLNPRESINEQGWGLLQVLLGIPSEATQENISQAFAVSAAKILLKRIENSAPEYPLIKFLHGWIKRVSTYTNPNSFDNNKL
ncbi:MAG: hypothetical protein WDZ41_02525 [Candidatus Babeliales bacterium]